jgi:hypothetical protein
MKQQKTFTRAELSEEQVEEIRAIAAKVNAAAAILKSAVRNYASQRVEHHHLPRQQKPAVASQG